MKLSPAQIVILKQVQDKRKSRVSAQTNADENTIHGPSAKRLDAEGYIFISNYDNGERWAEITTKGIHAIKDIHVAKKVEPSKPAMAPMPEDKDKIARGEFPRGSVIRIVRGRFSGHDVAVCGAKYISRGRNVGKYEYTLASMEPGGWRKAFAVRIIGTSFFGKAAVPRTVAAVVAAMAKVDDGYEAKRDRKDARDAKNRDAMEKAKVDAEQGSSDDDRTQIDIGQEVLVKYSDGARWQTVRKVNLVNGRVGIHAPHNKSGVRWIDSRFIAKVRHVEAALPFRPTDEQMAKVVRDGWTTAQVGRTEGARVYIIAMTAQAAKRGTWADGASDVVQYDPDTDMFWRNAGILD